MATRISQARFLALKRQATRRRRITPDLPHAQALDEIARGQGFDNWSLLAREVKPAPSKHLTVDPTPSSSAHQVSLRIRVLNNDPTKRKWWDEIIETSYPAKRYEKCSLIPEDWCLRTTDERGVDGSIVKIKRTIAFMDATGLRPSRAWSRLFGHHHADYAHAGFDHTFVWIDDNKRYVVTTEPYIGKDQVATIRAWCDEHGWNIAVSPNGRGIWNPCRANCKPDCKGHTQMVIFAPGKNGCDVQAVADRVSATGISATTGFHT